MTNTNTVFQASNEQLTDMMATLDAGLKAFAVAHEETPLSSRLFSIMSTMVYVRSVLGQVSEAGPTGAGQRHSGLHDQTRAEKPSRGRGDRTPPTDQHVSAKNISAELGIRNHYALVIMRRHCKSAVKSQGAWWVIPSDFRAVFSDVVQSNTTPGKRHYSRRNTIPPTKKHVIVSEMAKEYGIDLSHASRIGRKKCKSAIKSQGALWVVPSEFRKVWSKLEHSGRYKSKLNNKESKNVT